MRKMTYQTALKRFEIACRNYEMKGAQHPLDEPLIEASYRYWKKVLRNWPAAQRLATLPPARRISLPTDEEYESYGL